MSIAALSFARVSAATPALWSPAGIVKVVAEPWQQLMKHLFDPYRPELYYMRGPGPKWQEKYDRSACDLVVGQGRVT
jgi:hypothetical protein